MKRVAATVFFAICLAFVSLPFFYAPTSDAYSAVALWLRVTDGDVWFYKNPDTSLDSKAFLLEYTYYVKTSEPPVNGFYKIELMQNVDGFVVVYGYVPVARVTPVQQPPLSPTYPAVTLTATRDTVIYPTPSAVSAGLQGIFKGKTMRYYGKYPDGDNLWYYVKCDNYLCYVKSDGVTAPQIQLHPTPLYSPAEQDEPTEKEKQPESQDALADFQIALIVLVCIPSIVLVVILFLPTKSKKPQNDDFKQLPPDGNRKTKSRPRYFDDYL